jgi:hypothetical protein
MAARTRLYGGAVCLAILVLAAPPCSAETLREMLQREDIPSDVCRSIDLEKQITSGSATDFKDSRIIATYVQEGNSSALGDEFYLFRLDKRSGRWTATELRWPDLEISRTDGRVKSCHGGSLTRIDASDNFIYIDGHINPSASCTMVVTQDLKFHGTFHGWVVGRSRGDTVVYEHSEVHFAPTHYVELSIYDPVNHTSRRIYPLKPYQAVRLAYIAEVQAAYDECCPRLLRDSAVLPPLKDCGRNFGNHHCNAELFDNFLTGTIETNNVTDSLAFLTTFDDATKQRPVVVYVFRDVSDSKKMKYREFLKADLVRLYGDHPLSEYLSPAILSSLFAERP